MRRTVLEGNIFGQLVAEIFRYPIVSRQGPIVRRRGGENHVNTEIVSARLASTTPPAWLAGFKSDSVSYREMLDAFADRVYDPRAFVAKHHGLFNYKVPDPSMGPIVDITAADSSPFDRDDHIVWGLWFGNRSRLEIDFVGFLKHKRDVVLVF